MIREHFIDIAGRRGCYLEAERDGSGDRGGGDSPVRGSIVIVASMLVRAKSYRATMRALAPRGWRVVALEMPGCGKAARLGPAWSFEQYADWLAAFLDAMRFDRPPIVVGHSNSGPPVIIAAARHPAKMSAAAIVDSVGADVTRSLLRVLAGRAVDAVLETPLTLRAFHHVLYNLFVHPRNMLNQIRLAAGADLVEAARAVRVPTVLAWGRHDHTMPLRCAELLRQAMPHARLYIAGTGSHDWIVDEPRRFARFIDQHFPGQRADTSPGAIFAS